MTHAGGRPRLHPKVQIGDLFGDWRVVALIEPDRHRNERVRAVCLCGTETRESNVMSLRRAIPGEGPCQHGREVPREKKLPSAPAPGDVSPIARADVSPSPSEDASLKDCVRFVSVGKDEGDPIYDLPPVWAVAGHFPEIERSHPMAKPKGKGAIIPDRRLRRETTRDYGALAESAEDDE